MSPLTHVSICQRAKSIPTSHAKGVLVFQLVVPTCQKVCQFFNYFSKENIFSFWIFQLCLIFANFKNIWAILEDLHREIKNLNVHICIVSLWKCKINSVVVDVLKFLSKIPKNIFSFYGTIKDFNIWINSLVILFGTNVQSTYYFINIITSKFYLSERYRTCLIQNVHDLDSPLITINIAIQNHAYSLIFLVFLAVENSRKPLLLVTHRNQVFLYFHF